MRRQGKIALKTVKTEQNRFKLAQNCKNCRKTLYSNKKGPQTFEFRELEQ